MWCVAIIRSPPAFCDNVTMSNDNETVHLVNFFVGGFDERQNICGSDSLLLRATPRQRRSFVGPNVNAISLPIPNRG
jgi:hypothetical protein